MHSFLITTSPIEEVTNCSIQTKTKLSFNHKLKNVNEFKLNENGIYWNSKLKIPIDDIIGAKLINHNPNDNKNNKNKIEIYTFISNKKIYKKRLYRKSKIYQLYVDTNENAIKIVNHIQNIVKRFARVPINAERKIKVIINPHSGKKQAPIIWQKWKNWIELANIKADVEETTYGGHAIDMGKAYSIESKYESIVFIGGDGTVNEFLNGVLCRSDDEWKKIIACTPISLLSAGTDNAFGKGVGTPNHESSIYCIIKRKMRPVDVVACKSKDNGPIHFAFCGASFGIGADIAIESEATRWLGTHRYSWLKFKRSVLMPKNHYSKLQFLLSKPKNENLKTFEELDKEHFYQNKSDQHIIESCNIYNTDLNNFQYGWKGNLKALYNPGQLDYLDNNNNQNNQNNNNWENEEGSYVTIGAANLYFEAKYSHPSDGQIDLIIVRKGSLLQTINLGFKYLFQKSKITESPLMDYYKTKAIILKPKDNDPINFDGEVLEGPGPFCLEVLSSLITVLSEK